MSSDVPDTEILLTVEKMMENINKSYAQMLFSYNNVKAMRDSHFTHTQFVQDKIISELGVIEDKRQAILQFAELLQFAPFAEEMVQSEAKRDIA